ncbi:Hypothetical protein NTJ_09853 [Nesidiocoris tenuis]|uniref:Uncharacterized protein n=1 Tax=Nesidiocoris tenuis TaxID=355587 RepID=A0ABN7AXX8_9HEMI|nr:Hypothetical protein NTJ_09853 [Nesidiocoris tenuis]
MEDKERKRNIEKEEDKLPTTTARTQTFRALNLLRLRTATTEEVKVFGERTRGWGGDPFLLLGGPRAPPTNSQTGQRKSPSFGESSLLAN